MSVVAPAAPAVPRFEPALMRRKLTGTLFYGACVAAIGLLLVTLVVLLVDTFVRAAPWLDVQFLTSVPSSRPARFGDASPRSATWTCWQPRQIQPR